MRDRRDPYLVLGVPRSATLEEVRTAYRALAFQHHPDRTGSPDAQEFLDVREAYELICDRLAREPPPPAATAPRPRARSSPTVLRVEPRWSRWPARRRASMIHLSPLTARPSPLDRLAGLLEAMERMAAGQRHSVGDLHVELLLSSEEAQLGGEVLLPVPVTRRCRGCLTATVRAACTRCHGAGVIHDEEELEVLLPPGVRDGTASSLSLDELGWLGAELRVTVRIR